MHTGFSTTIRAILATTAEYFRARLALARLEGRQARTNVLRIIIFSGLALIGSIGLYATAILAATVGIAHACFQQNLIHAALAMAGLHLLILIAAIWVTWTLARNRGFFPNTITELKADKEWLKNLHKSKH